MSVTDEQMVWLRAYLSGDLEEARRVNAQATAPGAAAGLGALVHAAFVLAARRKFAPRWTRAEVIQFVARVRGLLSEGPDVLDPAVSRTDVRSRGRAQFILLNALVQSLDLDDAGVAGLLDQARGLADSLLGAGMA
jgi:hypothetical protein